MVERITNKQELVAWAKRVEQNGSGAKAKCIRQDEYMHSQSKDVEAAYKELDQNEVKTVSCAVYNVLSMDVLWELIRARARKIAGELQEELFVAFDKYQTEHNDKMDVQRRELLGKMEMLKAQEQEIAERERKMDAVKNEVECWKGRSSELSRQIVELRELQEKADKYDELRRLLA